MSKRSRIVILWLAAAFVLAMSAFSFAKVGENHGAEVSASHKPTATPSAEPSTGENEDQEKSSDESGERKLNHGFYVSSAAHCENVDDPDPEGTDFTAPADCDTNGKAHGEYVSSVAKSSVGKPDKGEHGGGEGS